MSPTAPGSHSPVRRCSTDTTSSLKAIGKGLAPIDVTRDEEEEENIARQTAVSHSRIACDADEVLPGVLWVGAFRSTKRPSELKSRGIRAIVNMSKRTLDTEALKEFRITEHDVVDSASQRMFRVWDAVIRFIDECRIAEQSVLICCHRGISRSVATATAYIMKATGLHWESALLQVQKSRPIAAPNFEFCRQLYVFGEVHHDADVAEAKFHQLCEGFAQAANLQRISPLSLKIASRSLDNGGEEDSEASAMTSHSDSSSGSGQRRVRASLPVPESNPLGSPMKSPEEFSASQLIGTHDGSVCLELEYAVHSTEVASGPVSPCDETTATKTARRNQLAHSSPTKNSSSSDAEGEESSQEHEPTIGRRRQRPLKLPST